MQDNRVGVICGYLGDKYNVQLLNLVPHKHTSLHINQLTLSEINIVCPSKYIYKNCILLYARELDIGTGYTGLERYGGLAIFEGIEDVKVVADDSVMDTRILLPSHFTIVNKVTVLNGGLSQLLSRNWDNTAIGQYRMRSQLIRRMYYDIRSCRGQKHAMDLMTAHNIFYIIC